MKKFISMLMSAVMVVTACLSLPLGVTAAENKTTINANVTYQTMRGFGASACWWAKDVGGWSNLDDIIKLLYDKNDGIGLNIYRYNLGAGSDKDELNYRNDRWAECFMNADGTYDWSRDANAQKALASAKKFAGSNMRVTLFCNSAPIYLTKNGCGTADNYWWDCNLDSTNYDAFAQYGLDCVDFFQNNGYRVVDISPVNEPYGHWCRDNEWIPTLDEDGNKTYDEDGYEIGHYEYYDWANQEGCWYSSEEVREVAKAFLNKFNGTTASQKGCEVSILEANDMASISGDEKSELENYLEILFSKDSALRDKNKEIRDNVSTISMHSYWTSKEAKQETANVINDAYNTYKKKYNVAQTEYCQMEADKTSGVYDLVNGKMTSGLGIDYGVALANVILDDLTVLNTVEWDWWTAVAYGGYTDGLVYVNKDDHSISTSKRLWAMGNFSKFTEEGSVRVDSQTDASGVNTVAFINSDGTMSVVFVNNNEAAVNTALNVNGKDVSGECCRLYVTDESRDLAETSASIDNITLPAKSVSTLVVGHTYNYSGVISPNCTEQGYTAHTCSTCGNILKTDFVNANGHNFGENSAVCLTCGASNPNYIEPAPTTSQSPTSAPSTTSSPTPTTTPTTSPLPTPSAEQTTAPVSSSSEQTTAPASSSAEQTTAVAATAKKVKVSKVELKSVKSKKSKQILATWKKNTKASGYELQYSTSKKFAKKQTKTVTIKKNKTSSATIKKLKGNKKYYVRLRAYKTVNKKKVYSGWSKVKTVKVKK